MKLLPKVIGWLYLPHDDKPLHGETEPGVSAILSLDKTKCQSLEPSALPDYEDEGWQQFEYMKMPAMRMILARRTSVTRRRRSTMMSARSPRQCMRQMT